MDECKPLGGALDVETCVETPAMFQLSKLKHDELLSNFAFNFDSRPYNMVFWNTNFKGLGGGANARAGEERFGGALAGALSAHPISASS